MHLVIFGPGYTASRLVARLDRTLWQVTAVGRVARAGVIAIDSEAARAAIATATHVLSSAPPAAAGDPVLTRFRDVLAGAPARWIGYLSSTGVYGDAGGAWVDEHAPVGGRRDARVAADAAWQALRRDVRVFRLPGIYGPGRSALDRVRDGSATRVDAPEQLFSRIHVDDIVTAVLASFARGRPGIYNLADDMPATAAAVTEFACDLLGCAYPPLATRDSPALSPMARGFYTESRLVAAGKARRELGITPAFPDYRRGLRYCLAADGR